MVGGVLKVYHIDFQAGIGNIILNGLFEVKVFVVIIPVDGYLSAIHLVLFEYLEDVEQTLGGARIKVSEFAIKNQWQSRLGVLPYPRNQRGIKHVGLLQEGLPGDVANAVLVVEIYRRDKVSVM